MSAEEITNNLKDFIIDAWEGVLLFIAKYMPVSLFLGVMMAHIEMLFIKKEPITAVFISYISALIVVYYSTPAIMDYFKDSEFSGVIFLIIGYFVRHIVKFVTKQERINKWLICIEKAIIQVIKNKLKIK